LAESSSLSLRTGYSPQVALNLLSLKRSYQCWIQGGNVTLVRTFTQPGTFFGFKKITASQSDSDGRGNRGIDF